MASLRPISSTGHQTWSMVKIILNISRSVDFVKKVFSLDKIRLWVTTSSDCIGAELIQGSREESRIEPSHVEDHAGRIVSHHVDERSVEAQSRVVRKSRLPWSQIQRNSGNVLIVKVFWTRVQFRLIPTHPLRWDRVGLYVMACSDGILPASTEGVDLDYVR